LSISSVEALRITSLSEAVRERLMRAIARGDLKPGARLNEAQMAQTLGVSRGPVREAARELEGQGFLVSRPNQGFYVVDFDAQAIRDVYEAKDWLETAFVTDLARSLTLLERREILAQIDALDRSDRLAFTQNLFDFRARVVARLNNRFLADLMTVLYRKFYIVSLVVDAGDDAERVARITDVLRRFWTAMARDDLEGASAVLRDDTAYWLADLPPSSGREERPEA
jgi:DNA-binding GntR family transcriptional regulator